MIRIGIVEDDAAARASLLDYLRRFQDEYGEKFTVTVYVDGADVVNNYRAQFDIILLDIQMETMDGMTAAQKIRETDSAVVLVFITSAPQYAIHGYQVGALSYLLKPVPWFAFSQEMLRSIAEVKKTNSADIVIDVGKTIRRIPVDDIVYIESNKHRLTVHMLNEELSFIGTLKDMENRLADSSFFRSNSYLLVNMKHVMGVEDQDCQMSTGERLRISRPRRKAFLAALASYFGENNLC